MPTKIDEYLVRWVDLKNGIFNEKEVSYSYMKDWLTNKDHIQVLHKEYVRTVSLV
ncbi:hypothetical protein P4V41_07420 [Fictibacillus nanhaiensis]|uniref:hypothetical protein n=1 Tax=Fictibacillus nanhaiensis TaxID=742169 RepID=UPI002E1E970C|nr:hypothetical protein [Fictibacillus nanhaiensis]